MTSEIALLNKRLEYELGANYGQPRFQWRYSPEVFYYMRGETALSFARYCWADLIGPVWMLCQSAPLQWIDGNGGIHPITREGWGQTFGATLPFPDKGMYVAHTETALAPGVLPDAQETAILIHSIKAQMAKTEAMHARESLNRMAKAREDNEKEFMEMADDWYPFNWKNGQAQEPGTRGGHISWGGV